MKQILPLLVFCVVLRIGASDRDREGKKSVNQLAYGTMGYGLELLLTKLEVITNKLKNMEDKLLQTENKLQKMENQFNDHRFTLERNISTLRSEMFTAHHKLDQDVGRVLDIQSNIIPSSCKDVLPASKASGTYLIRANSTSEPFGVNCEQRSYGGGWIVMQYRFDGSLDFYRGWNEFRDGFGDLKKEFWLGLEKVHQLTRARRHELIVELKAFDGSSAYARYDAFEVGSEDEWYALKDLGAYSGTAGESMSSNRDEKFSTKDWDNDQSDYNDCAQEREGAWWHFDCTAVNLNGRYMNADDKTSMYWDDFKNRQGLSYSRMMIREVE